MEPGTKERTKTVEGTFGPKRITRDEFIKRWTTSHYGQFYWLANTLAEMEELKRYEARIAEIAGAAWDRIPS